MVSAVKHALPEDSRAGVTALQRRWFLPSSGLHTSDCTTSDCVASGHLPCALQHTKRAISLKEHSRVERLFKDASF